MTANRHTDKIEKHAILQSASRIEQLVEIFKQAVKVSCDCARSSSWYLQTFADMEQQMEIGFWDMYSPEEGIQGAVSASR